MATKYSNHYINIDSSKRQVKDIVEYSKTFSIGNNKLKISNNKLIVAHYGHNFIKGQRIKIDGVKGVTKTIRTIVGDTKFIEIFKDTNIMKIFCKHQVPIGYNDYLVEINDFNIPKLNKVYNLYTTIEGYTSSSEWFYIKLPVINAVHQLEEFNFKLTFNFIGGICLEYFHNILTIIEIKPNEYTCNIEAETIHTNDNEPFGTNIVINKVLRIINGYRNQNSYKIDLQTMYNNIVGIKLVNTIFPVLDYEIPNDKQTLSWLLFGELQSINIKPGFYNITTLFKKINKEASKFNIVFTLYYQNDEFIKVTTSKYIEFIDSLIFTFNKIDGYKFKGLINSSKYIMMKIDNFNYLKYGNENYFAKINCSGSGIDTFCKNKKLFANPINGIKDLSISFYDSNHAPFNFNGQNHSFVIEIITLDETVPQANYYAKTSSNINMLNFNSLDPFF
jgi:hypothetical protein